MKNIKLYIIVASVILSACEQNATNVDIPVIEPKLVVQCFISPQKPKIEAIVSLSSPIYGRNDGGENWVRNATVQITDGTIQKTLNIDNSIAVPRYTIDSSEFKIKEGQTYTLFVTTPDGKEVNATCTVPFSINSTSLSYDWDTTSKVETRIGRIERTVRLNMKWRDSEQGQNYYRVGANVLVYSLDDTTRILRERMSNLIFSDLYTDRGEQGVTFERNGLERIIFEQIGGSVGQFSFRPKGIEIYILNCDENYYKYHSTLDNSGGDDPFSEPALVFSNVIGGLGCFGATNQYLETINF